MKLKLKKTSISERTKYTFKCDNGDQIIVEPGKNTTIFAKGGVSVVIDENITDVTIKKLHSLDDKEIYGNLKYINCESYEEKKERIALKKEWTEKHPGEENPYDHPPRIARFDSSIDNDGDDYRDKSKVQYDAICFESNEDVDDYKDEREKVRDVVATFPNSMQELYRLYYIENYTQVEICKLLNLDKSTVSLRLKYLEKKILKYFQKI